MRTQDGGQFYKWRGVAPSYSNSRRWVLAGALVAFFGFACFAVTSTHAASPGEVDAAIDKAVSYLLSQQKVDGSWETTAKPRTGVAEDRAMWVHYGGHTAIATYALLRTGMSPQDPRIRKAIDWLVSNDAHGTYVVGLRAGVWSLIPVHMRSRDPRIVTARDHDADFALHARIQNGPHAGFYGYLYGTDIADPFGPYARKGPMEGAANDRSNSAYGVLAAWGTERAGAIIPMEYWTDIDVAWKNAQLPDGGWNYTSEDARASTYTMTADAVATLYITQDNLLRSNLEQFDRCTGGFSNPNIDKGLAWLDKHLSADIGKRGGHEMYGVHAIGRLGLLSGRKYFGAIDWYKTASENVVRSQAADGSWGTIHDTGFAILFLCDGRAPVMMNKLAYGADNSWNERPRDVANLARWAGPHIVCSFLNWQTVDLTMPMDALLEAPVLYIAGSKPLKLEKEEIDKLRAYVEQGGMILGNADCGSKEFSDSFRDLARQMFPRYEFRRLVGSHPIFDEMFHAKKWESYPQVEAMSNGVRELTLLLPSSDAGRAWQIESRKAEESLFQLGGNIFLYATGRTNLSPRGETHLVVPDVQPARSIDVARIQVGEIWNPEPAGWPRLSVILHNKHHVDIHTHSVKLAPGALAQYHIAHWTGTSRIALSDMQRQELQKFVEGGGTLIIDAAGGSVEFADSVETELRWIFGESANAALHTPLPKSHPFYTDARFNFDSMRYRIFARRKMADDIHAPRMCGIPVAGGRIGVFYSREDLSAGLVGNEVDGIFGYEPAVAVELMGNMLLFADAENRGTPPAPAKHEKRLP